MDESDFSPNFGFVTKKRKNYDIYEDEQTRLLSEDLEDESFIPIASISSSKETINDQSMQQDQDDDLDDEDEEELDADVVVVHMDIREPLSRLRSILQIKLCMDLTLYCFTLQGLHLESSKNLVDQCIQGEGIVQINVKIKQDTDPCIIDIIDVLKPADDYFDEREQDEQMDEMGPSETVKETNLPPGWKQDIDFLYALIRLSIPIDPMKWQTSHVRHWILWAVRKFNLVGINLHDWTNMPGHALCSLRRKDFNRRVPQDPDNIFWDHCQILKTFRTVAIKEEKNTEQDLNCIEEETNDMTAASSVSSNPSVDGQTDTNNDNPIEDKTQISIKPPAYLFSDNDSVPSCSKVLDEVAQIRNDSNHDECHAQLRYSYSGTNLWQFLLELLTDWKHRSSIRWISKDGEFRILRPDYVAKLWGQRKNKPAMNYDKLSRALRYYYEGDMIAKVPGKRFVYKFICDLKFILGFTPRELNERVVAAEMRFMKNKPIDEMNNSDDNYSSEEG